MSRVKMMLGQFGGYTTVVKDRGEAMTPDARGISLGQNPRGQARPGGESMTEAPNAKVVLERLTYILDADVYSGAIWEACRDLYHALASELARREAVEAELSDAAVVRYVDRDGGKVVHRLWRDTMHDQGRDTIYRDDWEKLAVYDQILDRAIAHGLLLDFLGHVSACVSGRVALAASEEGK